MLFSVGCQRQEVTGPRIDQVTRLYIDSAGVDMLDVALPIHYSAIAWNDEYGLQDNAPVGYQRGSVGGRYFLEYAAGATRKPVGASSDGEEVYQSKIRLNIRKKLSETKTSVFNDTLIINYLNTPEEFRLIDATYNGKKIFIKKPGEPNDITVHK